jgi:hypothetical protein
MKCTVPVSEQDAAARNKVWLSVAIEIRHQDGFGCGDLSRCLERTVSTAQEYVSSANRTCRLSLTSQHDKICFGVCIQIAHCQRKVGRIHCHGSARCLKCAVPVPKHQVNAAPGTGRKRCLWRRDVSRDCDCQVELAVSIEVRYRNRTGIVPTDVKALSRLETALDVAK